MANDSRGFGVFASKFIRQGMEWFSMANCYNAIMAIIIVFNTLRFYCGLQCICMVITGEACYTGKYLCLCKSGSSYFAWSVYSGRKNNVDAACWSWSNTYKCVAD